MKRTEIYDLITKHLNEYGISEIDGAIHKGDGDTDDAVDTIANKLSYELSERLQSEKDSNNDGK